MVVTSAILLGLYVLVTIIVLLMPMRQRDPQAGMAKGCLTIMIVGLLALGGALALANHLESDWLIRTIYWSLVVPAIVIVGNLIAYPVIQYRKRKQRAALHDPPDIR